MNTTRSTPAATRSRSTPAARLFAALVTAGLAVSAPSAQATDGTWTKFASGLWGDTLNWSGGTVADGSGSTADFSMLNISSSYTATLDTARTLTNLTFGDTDPSTGGTWTVANNNAANILTLAGTTPTITVTNSTTTISAVIDGTSGLTKAGAGLLKLSGANTTLSGDVMVTAGTLQMGNTSALSVNNTVSVGASANTPIFDINGNALTIAGLNDGGGSNGTVTNASATTRALTLGGNGTYSYSGAITGSTFQLVKSGTGTQTLAGSNSYTGSTAVNDGTLNLTGSMTGTTAISTTGTGVFTESSTGVISGTSTFSQGGSGISELAGTNSYSGTTTVSAGTLVLTGSNSSAGATTLTAGTLSLGNATTNANGGLAGGLLSLNGGTIQSTDATSRSLNNALALGGGNVTFGGTSGTTGDLAFTNTGAVALGSTTRTYTVNNNTSLAQALSGTAGLTKAGAGTLTLAGSNSYSGTTTVSVGTLKLGSATSLKSGNALTTLATGTFDLNGNSQTLGALVNAGTVTNSGAKGTLTLTSPTASSGTGSITGALDLVVSNNTAAITTAIGTANNTGTITNNGTTGTGTTTITTVGSNVTGLTQSSTTSALTATTLNVASGGTTLTNTLGTKALTVTTAQGTGNLSLKNDSALAAGVTVGTASNTGTITSSGSNSTGTTTIGTVTANTVTGITQSGAGALTVTTLNTAANGGFGTTLTSSGTGLFTVTNAVAGTGGLTTTANSTGNITLAAGANMTGSFLNNGTGTNTVTVTGVLGTNVTGGVTQAGANSTLVLSNTNTFTGGLNINAGTVIGTVIGAMGTSSNTVSFGGAGKGVLDLQKSATTYTALLNVANADGTVLVEPATSGAGVTHIIGATTLGGDHQLTVQGGANVASGTAQLTTGAVTLTGNATLNVVNPLASSTATILQLGALADNGTAKTITKTGNGTLNLATAAGSLTAGTKYVITAGTLQVSNATALGSTPVIWDGGTFATNTAVTVSQLLSGTGAAGANNVSLVSNTLTLGDANNLDTTIVGSVSGTGALTKAGTGTLTLAGTNSYSGTTTVSAGTLALTGSNSSLTGATTLSGGTLSLGNATTNANGGLAGGLLTLNGGTIQSTDANIRTLNNALAIGGNVTFGGTSGTTGDLAFTNAGAVALGGTTRTYTVNNNTSLAQALSGTAGLTKAGAGTLTLAGSNSYGGTTTVNVGTLALTGSNSSAGATTLTAGTLSLGNATTNANGGLAGGLLTLNGGTIQSTDANIRTLNNALAIGGNVTFGGTSGTTGDLAFTNAGAVALGGTTRTYTVNNNTSLAQNFSGTAGLTKAGTGTLTLAGTNSYTGTTTVNDGTLRFANTASLYNAVTTNWTAAKINVKSGGTLAVNVGGTGEFTTVNVTTLLTALAASSSATNGMNAGSKLGFDTTNAGAGAGTFTVADIIGNTTGTSGGVRGLTKLGAGTLILSNANTYTGATTISGGTLALGVNNAIDSGSDIALTSGTFDLKTFTESAKSLTMSAGSTLKFDLSTAGLNSSTALLALTGGFTKSGSGTFNLDFNNQTFGADNTYKLTSFTGVTAFTANDFTLGGFSVANGEALSLSVVGGALMLTASAIPEPATYAALAGLGILILAAYRRRKTS